MRIVRTGVELLMLYRAPTDQEIEAVPAPAEFARVDRAETAMLGFRFGNTPWPHREPERDIVA